VRSSDIGEATVGQMLSSLVLNSHLMAPGTLADHLTEAARPLGVSAARIYLADLQQRRLQPMPGEDGRRPASLAVDSTAAGRAFQTITIQHSQADQPVDGDGRYRLWVPLMEGVERLGVLELCFPHMDGRAGEELDAATLESCRILASLAGLLVASKGTYSDVYTEIQRSQAMAPQAEMVWAFLAPRTFATSRVLFAAALEPAYEVGGDAFDHSLAGDHFHVSIVDSVGHDLTAALISSVTMASCRTTRRSGGGLTDIALRADRAISAEFGEFRFATALLCDLDIATGLFSWLPCGHPPPLLIRGEEAPRELHGRPCLPLGLAEIDGERSPEDSSGGYDQAPVSGYTEQLQPGDRLLLYTDGVIEGRGEDGRQYSLARLSDFIVRGTADGLTAPEILRRLNGTILEHQRGRLSDDATAILLEWRPEQHGGRLTA
jgi:hypothetical protein